MLDIILVLLILFVLFSIGIALMSLYGTWLVVSWIWCHMTVRLSLLSRLPHEQAAYDASIKLMDEYCVPRWVPFFFAKKFIKRLRAKEAVMAKAA